MNRLTDMLHFPVLVNAGATLNVLVTIAVTWYLEPLHPMLAGPWVALVLFLNLLPVVLLRLTITPETTYPPLGQMDFVHDQHKFSDWVYLAASANMAFWILLTWTISAYARSGAALVLLLICAFLVTFSPVLLRRSILRSTSNT